MRRAVVLGLCATAALALAGCERRGNLRTAKDHGPPPKARPVENPHFDPHAAAGDAFAVWRPAAVDRRGTVVAPGRTEREAAPRRIRPAGTF